MTLRELLDTATERPWRWARREATACIVDAGGVTIARWKRSPDSDELIAFIVALVNHAEDFIALWEAADVEARWNSARGRDDDALTVAVERLRPLMEGDTR